MNSMVYIGIILTLIASVNSIWNCDESKLITLSKACEPALSINIKYCIY